MRRILLSAILIVISIAPIFAFQSSPVLADSPTYEDFTTYTEVDEGGTVTKNTSRITYTNFDPRDVKGYVYYDKGANYFNSDFEHLFTAAPTSGSYSVFICPWVLANAVGDLHELELANENYLYVLFVWTSNTEITMYLGEHYSGSYYADTYIGGEGNIYYYKVVRNESVGANGTLYAYIYSDSTRTTLLDTLTVALHSKVDFRYDYAISSYDYNAAKPTCTGYIENMSLGTEVSYSLTTTSSAGGNVTTPGEGTYDYSANESVNIKATADTCYHFVNWTGDTATIANVSAASTTINMSTTNKSITANFAITQYTLTYTAGAGGIIAGTNPQTVNCGSNGSEVTAVPNACYYFVNWSDAVATANRTELNVSADLNVTANFASYTYEEPTTLTCNPTSTSIELNWILGLNTSGAYIRYKVGSYPLTLFDGNLIGTVNGTSYEHTGLTPGNSYFYKVWGINGNCISTNSTTVICTTYYGAGAGTTPSAPDAPDNWTGQLDDTELADLPVYEFGNLVADEGGIPYSTFWGIGIMGVMIVIALICYNKTHNLFLTCLSITIGLLALGALKVIPFFLVGLFVIIALVVTVKEGREI